IGGYVWNAEPDRSGTHSTMNLLRSIVMLAMAACAGCSSLSADTFRLAADLYRPLQIQRKPDVATVVPALMSTYPDADEELVNKSMRSLSFPRYIFGGITGYYDSANYLALADIHRSLDRFSNNPFAWSLMANYLALERQPLAATVASDHAIAILEEIEQKQQLSGVADLELLYWTAQINKAIFLNLAGEYSNALEVLAALASRQPEEPLIQMAVSWARCTALIGRGDPQAALAEIDRAAQKWPDDIRDSKLFKSIDYPQYLNSERREANFLFLRGEALLRLNNVVEAESILRRSIELDGELWNSYLSLATALYAQGKDNEARKLLKDLLDKGPEKGLYSMDLAIFNFANLNLQFKKYDDAADGFRTIIERAKKRDRKHQDVIQPDVPEEVRSKWEPLSNSRIVVESRNNLAATLLAIYRDRGDGKDSILNNVDSLLAESESDIAVENLARSKWLADDRKGAVEMLSKAVETNPQNENMRASLLKYGIGSGDSAVTYMALNAYLATVRREISDEESDTLEQVSDAADVLLSKPDARDVKERIKAIRHD
ncbi:MAG TPA: tetratricopeptide repeat protein, partial [Pyrinomonadaceae bacterium]|nr:tetratricopeptide repeat protein [Pyrinomonadaceae bacterium]